MSVPYMPTTEREAGDLSEEGCLGAQIKVLLLSLRCSLLRTVELLQDGVARSRGLKLSLYQPNEGADRYKSMSGLDCQILCVDCLCSRFFSYYIVVVVKKKNDVFFSFDINKEDRKSAYVMTTFRSQRERRRRERHEEGSEKPTANRSSFSLSPQLDPFEVEGLSPM
ncbi:uncharacterized protein MCYG_00343 [Microsporum canis CBS 113480]|uniref:Uncharacterized protein n=1 Tax=Arthroderma otae (strain ATCC MYA-4605 / CBS 113480) TaxID=554155 RepID=C5FC32_ARTOC|nr:uncharacterized protein MCYG_00343 [Microsporum canis CBS 113480]EEQ27455.1 predicted protein [Microsporum canis CBS 113480]